jgi:hypothetical protein
VGNILVHLLILFLLPPSSATRTIERAFLQNNAQILIPLLPEEGRINFSFPEPISFSDQLSKHQTYLFLEKIFTNYITLEFYTERDASLESEDRYIFKARWSFQDKKNNQYPVNIFFQLVLWQETSQKERVWKILEIRAETI